LLRLKQIIAGELKRIVQSLNAVALKLNEISFGESPNNEKMPLDLMKEFDMQHGMYFPLIKSTY